jgi:hypothetical protein
MQKALDCRFEETNSCPQRHTQSSWVVDNGSITGKNHGTETRTLPFRRSGSVSPYNDILVDVFGDPTNGRCRHTLTAALISIQVHAYARSSKGSAAWSCDVPYRRNSVRSGQPRASKCNSSVQPPLVWARPRQTFHEHISRKAPRTGGLRFLGARPALVCIAFAGTTFMDFPRVT